MTVLGHNGRAAQHRWPDRTQTLLLLAALGEGDVARAAWGQWCREADLDALDFDSHRMLPLLYRNLEALGIHCPDLPRLKGVYRYYWYGHQLLLRDAKIALQALHDDAIETLVLKGLALTATHYRNGATRPMYDVDVLVQPAEAPRALRVVRDLGYTPTSDQPFERQLRTRHAMGLRNEAGRELDLHWYALFQSPDDEDLWSDSVPLTIDGVHTRAPSAADQLLHVCVHGVSGMFPAPMRWLADAVTVIKGSGDTLDWARVVDRAVARQCTVSMSAALIHLKRELRANVPAFVVDRLGAVSASRAERLAHRAVVNSWAHGGFLALEWDRYRRLRAAGAPGGESHFAAYLLDSLELDGYRQLAQLSGRKAWRLARRG